MKQIFDWLRNYTQGMLERREQMIGWAKNDNDKTRYENENHFIKHTMLPIINEAEAKWESECCEWVHVRWHANCLCKCNGNNFMLDYDLVSTFKVCPYCGKRINIVEVE